MDRTIIRSQNPTIRRPKARTDCGRILLYHMAAGCDDMGRTHRCAIGLSDDHLQWASDWTRWTFPLRPRGDDGAGMPTLEAEHVLALRASEVARVRMAAALARMAMFLRHNAGWLQRSHFEHVRIARAICSARLVLSERESARFRQEVLEIMMRSRHRVDREVVIMWKTA